MGDIDIDTVRYCFVPDEKEVFAIAEITQRNADKAEATVSLLKGNKTVLVKYENIVAIGSMEELNNPPSDLIKLVYVNRPGILHTLRTRFMQDSIYTSIGPILVALNPFKWIAGVYEEEIMIKYKNGEANLSDQPHVFAVAQDAYSDLYKGSNQSLIISGESGAGKTEATKQCLNYLAFLAGSATGIQSKILKASPILEAWGNAKTLRNNNSSRFGKFIEIWFDSNHTITGSSNTTYILEKSRVVFQEKDERNYHVFYQLLRGGSPDLLQQLELTELSAQPEEACFINQSGCIQIENVDDAADFQEVNEAFSEIGFTSDEQTSLYTIIAGILHLGNVTFIENPSNSEESTIPAEHWQWLHRAARQLGVDATFVERALLHKQIRSGGNGKRMSIAYAAYKPHAAYENRNALAKEIYRRCFDYIVGRINALMENDKDQAVNMIGILDIFGFEIFQRNSFEQLCINLANEALQQHFNYNIFQAEMDIYNAEDVPVPPLEYKDNQDVLDLIMKRPQGLIPMLDEEGLVPRGSWEGFLNKYTKQHAKHPRFKKAKLTTDLGVVHYAGEVFYDASLFLVKNKDTLSADLVDVFSMSTLPLLQRLFTEVSEDDRSPSESSSKRTATQSAAKMTVGRSFSLQLEKLIADLNSTQPRYIRCIKPNQVKKPNIFVPDLTNEQLTYSGVFEAVIIMQNGYPFRRSHEDFRKQYHMLVRDAAQHATLFASSPSAPGAQAVLTDGSAPPPPPPPPPPLSVDSNGVVVAAKKVRKPNLPCSRAQCQLLVQLISEAYSGRSLERCFVGKTRTFYQAPQHNALEALRNIIVPPAVLKLQTCARMYIAHKLTKDIRLAEQSWRASLLNREVDRITPHSEAVEALIARLNRAVPQLAFSLECASIGKLYHHAFELESHLGPAIKAAIDEPIDIMDKYDRLEVMRRSLDTVNFNTTYRTEMLSFRWEDNAELTEQANKIVAMGELVHVKRKFQRGIAGKDEVALEEAVAELAKLKGQGKIVDDFCTEEATKAKRIIVQAEEMFATLISSVTLAIHSGYLTAVRLGDSFDLHVNVDPTALVAIVKTFDEEKRGRGDGPKPPMRIRGLQLLCAQLRDLRLLAKQGKWEDVWAQLQSHWNLTVESSDNSTVPSAFRMTQNFLPAELKMHLLDELKAVSLAAINFFVMPQVQAAVAHNTVPSTPSLGAEAATKAVVDTTELAGQIAAADAYAEYFDEGLHKYLKLAKEHLHFRTEMNSGDWQRIVDLSTRMSVIPATHPDRLHVHHHVKMQELVTLIKARIIEDRVSGEPGSVDFSTIQANSLGVLCEQALAMTVLGTAWTDLLEAARAVRLVRVMLQQGKFTEAWTFMQELQKSPGWIEVTTRVTSDAADETVADALRSVMAELQSYDKEILHARSMRDIALALSQGGILDETEDFSTHLVDANSLQAELDAKIGHLILTPAAKRLIDDTETVIKSRTLALTTNWTELEQLVVPLHSATAAFAGCHPGSQVELKRYYDKIVDLKVHRRLLDSMQNGQLQLIASSVDVRCDISAISAAPLQESIAFARQGSVLSRTTLNVLTVASALYCLRSAVLQEVWEPAKFFFGSTPTADLVALFEKLDIDPSLFKAKAALESTIGRLDRLESELNYEKIANLVAATDLSALSLSEVVAHLRRNTPTDASIQQEVEAAERLNNDRRCKLMLLMSASTGMIQGNLDEFECSGVVTNHLEVALAYVTSRQHLQPSNTVRNWSEAAKYLVSVRRTIIRAANEQPGVEPVLSEVFHAQDLQDILKTIDAGYPTKELRLVLNKLRDQASIQELLQALLFGQAIFENGKVDVARVQYAHLEERLEAAKKNTSRSDKLDRLFFYIELTISMRKAISWGQWELNDREKSVAEGANARLTVKRCMKEFEQARRFFSSPVEGVPPSSLIDEFRLIGREWERRLVKQRFATAFKAGAVTGHPLSLNLKKIRTDLLETEIARMKEAQNESTEKDSDFELFMHAGEELITMRTEAAKIHASYKLPVKFSFPSNSLHNILDAQDFIPDAIAAALSNVERISRQPYKFAEEWSPIANVVSSLKACPQIPATLEEVSLLRSETQDRAYIVSVLNAINAACGARSPKSSRNGQQDIVTSLTAAQLVYDQRQAENLAQQVKTKSSRSSVLFRHSKFREVVHNSAVTLLHYVRTNAAMVFDTYARDWSEDKNFSKTPRIYTLAQNLTTSYTMQQILRSVAKVELHTKVRGLLDAATMRLEDAVSRQEMVVAFSEEKYVFTGTVGAVKAASQAVPYMKYVLERVDKTGVQDFQVARLRNYFRVHLQLRQSVESQNYPAAFEVLDDFVGNGKRSLEFVLEVLNNRNYQVVPEALQEFLLLAQDICDHTWQLQAEKAVVTGRIRGKRGAIHVTEIDIQAIDEVLRVLQLMPVVSDHSEHRKQLCLLVKELRYKLLGDGVYSVDPLNATNDQSVAFQKLQFAQNRSDFGNLAPKVLHKFIDQVIATVSAKVDSISAINITWTNLEEINSFAQYVQPVIDALDVRVNGELVMSGMFREELLQECELVHRHCESLQAGLTLEAALQSNIAMRYSAEGLEIQPDTGGLLVRTLSGAIAQRWQFVGHPEEYWWACLTALGKTFLGLYDHVGLGAYDKLMLRPGTVAFKSALPEVYALIAQVNNITKQLKLTGHRKRATLPSSILTACDTMRLAIAEHNTLFRLEKIIGADCIENLSTEDTSKVIIKVVNVRPILHISKDEEIVVNVNFEQYGRGIKAMVSAAKVDTTLGKLLVDMLHQLLDLRMAVANRRWFVAKQICAGFQWIGEFAISPDVEVCQRFLRYKECHRAIENAILCCSLPSIVGWSLHSASREIAMNINDRVLSDLLLSMKDKYGSLVIQYITLSQLIAVGEKMLSLLTVLRKSLWVGAHQYSEEFDHSNEGPQYFSAEDLDAPLSLRSLVESSSSLEPYMQRFLLQTAANLENEMLVVKLEHCAQKTLRTVAISGKPGELTYPPEAVQLLQTLSEQVSSADALAKRCHCLLAAAQVARVLIRVIEAHQSGDLTSLVRHVDLLNYLSEIDCRPGSLLLSAVPVSVAVTDDELLKMDDSVFGHVISVKATPTTLPTSGQGSGYVVSSEAEDSNSSPASYWDVENIASKGELQKAFVLAANTAFSEAILLRAEVKTFLHLLHHHAVLESMYREYVQVVKVSETQTEPGALNISKIKVDQLSAFVDKYRPYFPAADSKSVNVAHNMLDMVVSLYTVRQGQINSDIQLISIGLEQAGAACVAENNYQLLDDFVPFGEETKLLFDQILEEIELADQDLKQRRLIDNLRTALSSPGIPTTHYPFDIGGIRIEALDAAYEDCKETPPACPEARRLHQAASVLLVVRKYALRRDWVAMIEFVESIEEGEMDAVFVEDELYSEFEATKEVMMVSHAIDLALESYLAGYIGGTVGAIAPCGDTFLDFKGPQAAMEVFARLDVEWIVPRVLQHANTCETLQAVRANTVTRAWDIVYPAANSAMDGLKAGWRDLVPFCIPEIKLARDHAAYMISCKELQRALDTGSLRGTVGDVHVWQVEIDTLQEVYKTVTTINCRRDDVLRLKKSVEFLFRIRKAILLDQWIHQDITHDYLNLLGSNFQLQSERVQQNNLNAVLRDESLRNAARAEADTMTTLSENIVTVGSELTFTEEEPAARTSIKADLAQLAHTEYAPEPVFETVETILQHWAEIKASRALSEEAMPEVELAHQEMRHRQMVSMLLKNLHTPGIQGLPGQIDTAHATTRLLEKAILTANENSDVSQRGDCKGLLRDAKLLLMARRYRINEQWVELHHMLEEIELTLSNEMAAAEEAEATASSSSNPSTVTKDYIRPIVKPVWQELQLLKFDCLFQLHLTTFTFEMTKPAPPAPPGDTESSKHVAIKQAQVDALREILEASEAAALEFPSIEFNRLIEAQACALELRIFAQQFPNKSPQEIIHHVALAKKRDEEAGLTSYMSLLIHDISKMANVLDFPVNLKTIHREIVKGQKYFSCPIGTLETWLIDVELMSMAYNAAIPSLELFGTASDHSFMRMAEVVIKLRGALLRGGLSAAIQIIDDNDVILQDPLMKDEVDRLRIEVENYDAGKLMEIGLKTGRYIDVLSIARMVHNYECRLASKAAESTRMVEPTNANEFMGPEAKRQSRRQAQQTYYARDGSSVVHTEASKRTSNATVAAATEHAGDDDDIDATEVSTEPPRVERRSRATVAYTKRLSVQVEDGTASEEFIEGVFRSINALNRAIAIAHQVRVRSSHTEYYLNAVQVILRLRENTVADNWDEVRTYLESEENWSDLPAAALEEIHACKEGMLYQKHMVQLTQAFYAGAIYGLPHEIDYDTVSFDQLLLALEECQHVRFTDPSAVILMEFAERLVSVRHLLLEDQWQDAEDIVVLDDFSAEGERTTKLRKSVYSHPLQKKNEHKAETVDECVRDFLEYQSVALPKLQRLLRTSGSSSEEEDWGEKVDLQEVLKEARRVLSARSVESVTVTSYFSAVAAPGVRLSEQKPDEWMEHMWQAVLHVVLELNLAQQATKYRTVLFNLSAAADSIPELVKVYRGDKHHVHAHVHPLLRSAQHHEDVTLYGAANATSTRGYLDGKKYFNVKDLQTALQRAKDYLFSVGFETSEEMLQLQQTSNILLEFRTVLNAQESHEDLLQLLRRTKQQDTKGFISTESGVHELNAYIAATAESVRIQAGLRSAMHAHYAYGPLNALHTMAIRTEDLQKWIDEAMIFLARGGSALSIGIPSLLLQARVMHKLRSALINHEWSVLEYTLRCYEAQAVHWEVAGPEFRHIQCAFRFRQVKREMRQFLRSYTSAEDVEHGIMSMDIDLRELNSIFTEIHKLLQYRSPLLLDNPSSHFAAVPGLSTVPTSDNVFTKDFFAHFDFAAAFALWRLFQALHNNQWFLKQTIHDNEHQRVAETIDPLLNAYFGLGDANFIHNIVAAASGACVERCFAHGADKKVENVFEVLVATQWVVFPYNVRKCFNRVRNCLIDKYIRVNLKYYCKKGAIKMDSAGNLVVSSVNLQFLKFALQDAHRAEDLAMSLSVPFKWSAETQRWLDSANTVLRYRHALIVEQNTDAVLDLLRQDGLLRGHTQFDPKLFTVHVELEVVEKYAQAYIAERTALHCLQFLVTLKDQSEVSFQEVALENEAVLEVFELAAAPISVAEPSSHLLDMLSIVTQLRDAIFSAMLGGSRRLAPILESLRHSIGYHPHSTLQLADFERAASVLTTVCKKSYNAELLDFGAKPTQKRFPFIATAFASPGRPSRYANSPMRSRNNYIGLADTAARVTPRTPTKSRTASLPVEEKTGLAMLQAFTQKIVTALCELMYFHEEESHLSVGGADRFTEKLRVMVPTSARSQAPYHCFLTLSRLKKELNEAYAVYEPRWVAALQVVLFYLQKEINQQESSEPESVAQMVNLSQDLIQFCKDIQLDRCVLADYVQAHFKKVHVSSDSKSSAGASAPDCAPSVLILVKHLSTIKLQSADTAVDAALGALRSGLEDIVHIAASVAARCVALSLENDVYSEVAPSNMELIRSLPIGSVSRATSQSKLLCKALLL